MKNWLLRYFEISEKINKYEIVWKFWPCFKILMNFWQIWISDNFWQSWPMWLQTSQTSQTSQSSQMDVVFLMSVSRLSVALGLKPLNPCRFPSQVRVLSAWKTSSTTFAASDSPFSFHIWPFWSKLSWAVLQARCTTWIWESIFHNGIIHKG